MKRNDVKLNNLIFPIWLLWLFPITWIIVLPANYLIDTLVLILTMKYLTLENIKLKYKSVIVKVWLFGFLSDFIGTVAMFMANIIDFDYNTQIGKWWYENITNAVSYNPFENIYAVLWVICCILITSFFIYLFNYKISFKNLEIEDNNKRKLALSLAIFTAPYLFFLPTQWFY